MYFAVHINYVIHKAESKLYLTAVMVIHYIFIVFYPKHFYHNGNATIYYKNTEIRNINQIFSAWTCDVYI